MRRLLECLTLAALSFATFEAAFAAVPTSITVQGKLTDAAGVPLAAGPKSFNFKVYASEAGGIPVWPSILGEPQVLASDASGLWIALMGAISPLTESVFADTVRWLEITVDGVTLPRVRLATGPYAHRVATVDGASGGMITSKVSIGSGHTNSGADAFVAGVTNTVSGESSTIPGGVSNIASGDFSLVSGGSFNEASGRHANIGGGLGNYATDSFANVGGGSANAALAKHAAIGGGQQNWSEGALSTIGGGHANTATDMAAFATVGGGHANELDGPFATIGGGDSNHTSTGTGFFGEYATIGGGRGNRAGVIGATVGGGHKNIVYGEVATIGGGRSNFAPSIAGTVAGGFDNYAGDYGFVGGGQNNSAGSNSAVAGGSGNRANPFQFASVGGGENNLAHGLATTVPGGFGNEARGDYSFAAGKFARAAHDNSFVWNSDPTDSVLSDRSEQFMISAGNGVRIDRAAGASKDIDLGDIYKDNLIIAWGSVNADGTILDEFGVSSLSHTVGTGVYRVNLDVTTTGNTANSLVVSAILEVDNIPNSDAAARLIYANMISGDGNSFDIFVTNGSHLAVDNQFMFIVTAR